MYTNPAVLLSDTSTHEPKTNKPGGATVASQLGETAQHVRSSTRQRARKQKLIHNKTHMVAGHLKKQASNSQQYFKEQKFQNSLKVKFSFKGNKKKTILTTKKMKQLSFHLIKASAWKKMPCKVTLL